MNIKQVIHLHLFLTFLLIYLLSGCAITDTVDEGKLLTRNVLDTEKVTPANQKELPVFVSGEMENVKEKNISVEMSNRNENESIVKDSDEEKTGTNTVRDNKDETSEYEKDLPVYGYVEYVFIGPDKLTLKAMLDSGSKTSSLAAIDIVEFERDGDKWVKFYMIDPATNEKKEFEKKIESHVKIKQNDSESQRRPVVMMEVQLGAVHINREFSIMGLNNSIYQAILGRNFMSGVLLIDVSQKFLAIARSE